MARAMARATTAPNFVLSSLKTNTHAQLTRMGEGHYIGGRSAQASSSNKFRLQPLISRPV